jgi:hypothetical protein
MGFPQDADFASILRDYMRQYAPSVEVSAGGSG